MQAEMDHAFQVMRSGDRERGLALLQDLLDRTEGETNWDRRWLALVASAVFSRPELETESDEIFRRLVPESIDRTELGRRLQEAVELLFHDAPAEARFYHCHLERELSFQELVDDLWLESGYLRWVNFYRCGPCWVKVVCGGIVETFREVLHHDEGTAPFHLLRSFESLEEGDLVRLDYEGDLAIVRAVRLQPEESYELRMVDGLEKLVRPWEIRRAYFSDAAEEQRVRSGFH